MVDSENQRRLARLREERMVAMWERLQSLEMRSNWLK
jgi:hypothetical protein